MSLQFILSSILVFCDVVLLDSPGVPPSATAHELFRGFSYIAPSLLDEKAGALKDGHSTQSLSMVLITLHRGLGLFCFDEYTYSA